MHHYEIVIILNPNQSEQAQSTISRYKALIEENKGNIHRYEDWGRRQLAYPINKFHKGHYVLLNIETTPDILDQLVHMFKYNDVVMRHLIIKKDRAVDQESPVKQELDHPKPVNTRNRYTSHNTRTFGATRNRFERSNLDRSIHGGASPAKTEKTDVGRTTAVTSVATPNEQKEKPVTETASHAASKPTDAD